MKRYVLIFVLGFLFLAGLSAQTDADTYKIRYEHRDSFTLAGVLMPIIDFAKMNDLWHSYFEIKSRIPNPVSAVDYGVSYYDPAQGENEEYMGSYFVGCEISPDANIPSDLFKHTVPAGYYAVFTHQGPVENVPETYQYIYGTWVRENGVMPMMQDSFELYDQRFRPDSEDSLLEIWVPLQENQRTGE